jgi:hypothetical protein
VTTYVPSPSVDLVLALARPDSLENLRTQCSTLVSSGLRKFNFIDCRRLTGTVAGTITGISNAAMNYRNYKRSIQLKHGVQLVGWPLTCPFKNPSQISSVSSLKTIRNAVSMGVCAWRRMSEAEIATVDLELEKEHKAGTKTKKVRKVRTKNKNSKTKALTAAQVEEDSDESGDEEKEDQQSMTLKRKKGGAATDNDGGDDEPPSKKRKPQAQKKGKPAVTKARKRSNVARKLPPGPSSKEFISSGEDSD